MLQKTQTSLEKLIESGDYKGAFAELSDSGVEQILSPTLFNGWEIVRNRSEDLDKIVKSYFADLIKRVSKQGKIVLVASGSYGRKEITPNSDNDITFLTDFHAEEDSETDLEIRKYLRPAISAGLFHSEVGYHSLEMIPQLDSTRFCTLMDMRLLLGDEDFYEDVKQKLKENMNLNRFIRHRLAELDSNILKYPEEVNNVGRFDVKYGIGGLRQAMTSVWLEGSKHFEPSLGVYSRLPKDFVDSIGVLHKLRAWLSLRKKSSDLMTNEDFLEFKEHFGGDSAHRILLDSRKSIRNYVSEIRHQILERGVPVNEFIEFTESGLKVDIDSVLMDPNEVFYTTMGISQREGLQLSRSLKQVFVRNVKKYVEPREDFLRLFHEEGSLYKTLRDFEDMDVLGKFIPGYPQLETSHYQRDHRNFHITRGEKALRNIERLEKLDDEFHYSVSEETQRDNQRKFFKEQYDTLSCEQKATLRFHLLTQDIPKITGQSTEEFYSMLQELYKNSEFLNVPDLIFMNNHKRFLVDVVRTMLVNEDPTIESVAEEVGDLDKLKMLLSFTYAHYDFGEKQKLEGRHWQSLKMLHDNVKNYLEKSDKLPFNLFYYDESERAVLEKIPNSFFRGERCNDPYKVGAWIKHVMEALKDKELKKPRVVFKSTEDGGLELAVMYQDYPGSLWRITGTCYEHGIDIKQASGYVIEPPYELSMDFLKINLPSDDLKKKILEKVYGKVDKKTPEEIVNKFLDRLDEKLRENVGQAKELEYDPREIIKDISPKYSLDNFGGGKYKVGIRFNIDKPGILYSFTRILSEVGDITGFKTYSHSNGEKTDSFFLRVGIDDEELKRTLDRYFNRS